jgi:ATP/ADP translocase
MPQFDLYSFSVQVFTILVSFFFVYFFILRTVLSPFSEAFKFRKKVLTTISSYARGTKSTNLKYNFFNLF